MTKAQLLGLSLTEIKEIVPFLLCFLEGYLALAYGLF
jgi:hypothetical protein